MDSLKQAFDTLEGSVKQLESKMEHVNEAIELIKTYGFQPHQFEELLRIQRGLKSDDSAALKRHLQKPSSEEKSTQLSAPVQVQAISPIDKLQILLVAVFVSLMSSFLIAKLFK